MNGQLLRTLIAFCVLAACGEAGPPLSVTNTQVIAPAPGRTTSVAYLEIRNHSDRSVTMTHISSPQFSRVEMHETVFIDGVARMQALSSLTIDANATLEFNAGGKHVMLFDTTEDLIPGKPVALHIHFASESMLIVEATLQQRHSPAQEAT